MACSSGGDACLFLQESDILTVDWIFFFLFFKRIGDMPQISSIIVQRMPTIHQIKKNILRL